MAIKLTKEEAKKAKADALALGKKAEALAKQKVAAVIAALKKKKGASSKEDWAGFTKLMLAEAAKIKDGKDKQKVLETLKKI
jgi:hypothetical protein